MSDSNAIYDCVSHLFMCRSTLMVLIVGGITVIVIICSVAESDSTNNQQSSPPTKVKPHDSTSNYMTIFKDRREFPHKLADAIEAYHLGDSVENSHRAIDDAKSLLAVLQAMDKERPDLIKYINLFGYNPKYGVNGKPIPGITYKAQP